MLAGERVLAVLWLGEEVGLTHLVGGGLIVGGGLWAAWRGPGRPDGMAATLPGKIGPSRHDWRGSEIDGYNTDR